MIDCLNSSQLYKACDPSLFSFKNTDELKEIDGLVGQERALDAIDFSTNIKQDGYNLFAMGPSGSGKFSTIKSFLEKKAENETAPKDWCYVNNFKDPQKPIAIDFEAGKASEFKEDIYELIGMFKAILPTVFESNDYQNELEAINQKYINLQTEIFNKLEEEAKEYQVSMKSTSRSRVTFVPIVDGKILSNEEFNAIEGDKKKEITERMGKFEMIVKEALRKVTALSKSQQQEFKGLNKRITERTVETLIEEVSNKYKDSKKIMEYLDAIQEDVIRNVEDFLVKMDDMSVPPFMKEFYTPSFSRYKVNLFITQNSHHTAPVVFEDNPTYNNLIGTIEHASKVGTLVTDFSMIRPGAFHKANGGYLLLDVRKLLMKPFAYEELKRVLRSKEIKIESLAQQYSFISTTSLEPEAIPLDIKIVLTGERILYYLLHYYDPDFKELFKVNADFEDEISRSDENIELYARMIGSIAKKHELYPLSAEAVARVVEHSSREVSHASKFSTHQGMLSDLLKEADYWSKKSSHNAIEVEDVTKVLDTRKERLNRVQKKIYESIEEGTIMINISGSAVGQVNALSYISMGGYNFGIPSKLTARTRIGKGNIIDIEREVELGGPIHSKGVMILSAYLGSTYASDIPLSLSASLVFEQSYSKIEGDSASSTELYALLSSLSDVPIKQNFAVTGSVNQFGEIQPIGGVNEKIEGFFDVCMNNNPKAFYGVIIPHSNIKHLMLKKEVVEAVEKGNFAVYGVKTVNEGISILTGVEAGEKDNKGNYPASSINGMVVARLKKLSATTKKFLASKVKS